MLKIEKDKLPENNELPSTTYEAKHTVCPLGWRFRRSIPTLMIAFYIETRNTKIWKLVLCAKRYVIRSEEMIILVLPRGHLPR
jgi:hypothetical protein